MTEASLPIGSIRLYDRIQPVLPAGTYRVTSSVEVADANTGSTAALPPAASDLTHLDVGGPRFALGPQDVAAMHPPATARGAFSDRLPHVALGRRTLPWERTGPPGAPWLALLVAKRHTDSQAGEVSLQTGPLQAMVGAAVYGALQAIAPVSASLPVTVARFASNRLLRSVLPSTAELSLLAHVRQVNVADTALDVGDDDGWFAVVTSNRLPLDAGAGTEYIALLVSLEARTDVLALPADDLAPPPLIVLWSWTFTSAGGGTFEQLAGQLGVGLFGAAAPASGTGAVTLQHIDRSGTSAAAGYRPPLLAAADLPAWPADADLSGPAAFELGRLLAAADGRFTREIVNWHRALDRAAADSLTEQVLARAIGPQPPADREADRASVEPAASPSGSVGPAGRGAAVAARLRHELGQAHPAADRSGLHPGVRSLLTGSPGLVRALARDDEPFAGQVEPADELSTLAGLRDLLVPAVAEPSEPSQLSRSRQPRTSAEKTTAKKTTAKKSAPKRTAGKKTAGKAATEKPAAKEPAAKEPATEKPAAKEPAAKEPAAKKSAANEPAAKEPAARKSATEKPAVRRPRGTEEGRS